MTGAFHAAAFDAVAFDIATQTWASITLDGVALSARRYGLTIRDILNDAPNTCSLTCDGPVPQVGQALRVAINEGAILLFAGSIQTVDRSYEGGRPVLGAWPVAAIDDTARANYRRPFGTWVSTSATTIGEAIAADFAPDFTTAIEAGLPNVSITFDGSETFIAALVRLANLFGGYAKVEDGVIYLFIEDSTEVPDPVDIDHPPLNEPPIRVTTDASQLRTRVYGKGHGENLITDVAASETILPIKDATMFNPAGGQAIAGTTPDGAQSQILDYTGVQVGGGGSLVGPGASPSSAPTLALAAGTGVTTGSHDIATVFVTAAGQSVRGPLATIVVGFVAAPSSAPTAGTPTSGAGIEGGATVQYDVTNVTAAGETTPSPLSNQVTTTAATADPTLGNYSVGSTFGGSLDPSTQYNYKFGYERNSDGALTLAGPASQNVFTGASEGTCVVNLTTLGISAPSGFALAWYRRKGGAGTYKRVTVFSYGLPAGFGGSDTYFIDGSADGTLGAVEPSVNGTVLGVITVTSIPVPSDALVTSKKLYRSNGGAAKFVTSLATGATSYVDSTPTASLGADAPSSNTAAANQIGLTAIPIGAAAVTSRELYMSPIGGGTRRLALTIADNTTTTGTITISDATLASAAAEPTVDTSGLTQPDGQINPGATAILVAGLAPFNASGGWWFTGTQAGRYTGFTGSSLTGVTGLVQALTYNTVIAASPALIGVTGNALPMLKGTPVHIWVQRDDLSAQALQAARDGSDGIVEYLFTDMRRGEASLIERCDAELALFARPIVTAYYHTRDVKTKSGKTVTIDLPNPLINEVLTIQEVTITEIDIASNLPPRFAVTASSVRFSLEDMLRRLVAA